MDALILAAGEGTRLRPLTRTRPKPLFPILNRPLLEITFNYLSHFSIRRVILNTHHLPVQIEEFVQLQKEYRPFEIETRYEPEILNTGGGIGNTRNFWRSDPFVVVNGDILTDIDLRKAIEFHRSHKGPVTLILHDYPEFNQIAIDAQGRVLDFRQKKGQGLAFTGIHILNRKIFDFLSPSGNYDIIPVYQQMIQKGLPVRAYISRGQYWRDIGTPRSYLKAHEELLSGHLNPDNSLFPSITPLQRGTTRPSLINSPSPHFNKEESGEILIHPEAVIEPGVKFSGWACIGRGCLLKTGCQIRNSVFWEDVVVESEVSISESIIGQAVHLKNDLHGEVMI